MIASVYIEVEDNPNCSGHDPMRYRELGPPMTVSRVRLFDRRDEGEWCLVTGVRPDTANPWEPARVRKVEDSGTGVAYLIYGGLWGIRLCPADRPRPWSLDDRDQWGEPYLLLTDSNDLLVERPDQVPGEPANRPTGTPLP